MIFKFLCFFLLFKSHGLWAHEAQELQNIAKNTNVEWKFNPKTQRLSIVFDLSKTLDEAQIKTLNSGFSTYSQMQLNFHQHPELKTETFRKSCTVKFDTWEELYEVNLLDVKPQSTNVTHLQQYFDLCLNIEITQPHILALLLNTKNPIEIYLQIEQISTVQSAKIKEWLINQQSGVMQGLFAHMLGKLSHTNSLNFSVSIPTKPKNMGFELQNKKNVGVLP